MINLVPPAVSDAVNAQNLKTRFRNLWLGALSVAGALIYSYISYQCGKFEDSTDFEFQRQFFLTCCTTALLFGLNVGYTNSDKKLFWTCTDVLWISTVLLSIGGILSPLEQHFAIMKAESADIRAKSYYDSTIVEIEAGVKAACSHPQDGQQCAEWQNLEKAVKAPGSAPSSLLGRLLMAVPKVQSRPLTTSNLERIEKLQFGLDNAIGDGEKARLVMRKVDIGLPYLTVFILIVALGLRAGKTGADFSKSLAELRASTDRTKLTVGGNFKEISLVMSGGGASPTQTYIDEAYVIFIFPAAVVTQSVITIGDSVGKLTQVTVAHGLEELSMRFPSLSQASIVDPAGAIAGPALVNIGRVRRVDVTGTVLTLYFVEGQILTVAASGLF